MIRAILAIVLLLSLAAPAPAASVVESGRLDERGLSRLLGGYLVSLDSVRVTADDGLLFILGREPKKRTLEWFLFDPFRQAVVRRGKCPFKAFSEFGVSERGDVAMVFSQYPAAAWQLQTASGQWTQVFENPRTGTAFGVLSSLAMFGREAYTIMDETDREGFVKNTWIVALGPLQQLVTLKQLRTVPLQGGVVKQEVGRAYLEDAVRFAPGRHFAYVLKSKNSKGEQPSDYLIEFSYPGKFTLLDSIDGTIFPLDFQADPVRALYRRDDGKTVDVTLLEGGKRTSVMSGHRAIAGAIVPRGLEVAVLEGQGVALWMGTPGKMQRVYSLKTPQSVCLCRDGKRVVLIGGDQMRLLTVKD